MVSEPAGDGGGVRDGDLDQGPQEDGGTRRDRVQKHAGRQRETDLDVSAWPSFGGQAVVLCAATRLRG